MSTVVVGGNPLSLADLRMLYGGAALRLDPACLPAVEASAAAVNAIVASGRTVYGINTGFGLLAQTSIPAGRLAELQRRLVLSHAAGVGRLLPPDIVRLILALKVVGLARGYSGVRPAVIDQLLVISAMNLCYKAGCSPIPTPTSLVLAALIFMKSPSIDPSPQSPITSATATCVRPSSKVA